MFSAKKVADLTNLGQRYILALRSRPQKEGELALDLAERRLAAAQERSIGFQRSPEGDSWGARIRTQGLVRWTDRNIPENEMPRLVSSCCVRDPVRMAEPSKPLPGCVLTSRKRGRGAGSGLSLIHI